jgi:hypothetical protein
MRVEAIRIECRAVATAAWLITIVALPVGYTLSWGSPYGAFLAWSAAAGPLALITLRWLARAGRRPPDWWELGKAWGVATAVLAGTFFIGAGRLPLYGVLLSLPAAALVVAVTGVGLYWSATGGRGLPRTV